MELRRRNDDADEKVAWLASQPWWSDFAVDDLRVLAATGDRVTLPTDRDLMFEGQRGIETAVVISGELEVVHDGTVVARLGPGDVVGELAVLDGVPRTADVRSATEVELLVFSASGLKRALDESPAVREQVTRAADEHRG